VLPATDGGGLHEAYVRALAQYVAAPAEAALADAYALGRRALAARVNLIDWAAIHEDAVALLAISTAGPDALARAGTFFRESLSPFEMTQRGYAETNTWLERLNHDLRSEIAQKERLAEQLQESNGELEAFSYSVAHDLRAPLRHIGGFSAILVEDHEASLDQAARDLLTRIGDGVRRMSDLIDGLLTLSRAARAEPIREPIDLAIRARAIVSRLRQTEPNRDVVVDVAGAMNANGDPRLLDAVLENLIGNAWKFTSKVPRGHIAVGVDASRTPPVYFVRDDGAGFDMNHASKLFGAFQRLHTQESFPGTGIGLATVQRIVRRHGGRVWAESQIDRGTTFYFTLEGKPLPRP
jgi:light-regulated signal transduction histidine kinase (bacteriophytochrome)